MIVYSMPTVTVSSVMTSGFPLDLLPDLLLLFSEPVEISSAGTRGSSLSEELEEETLEEFCEEPELEELLPELSLDVLFPLSVESFLSFLSEDVLALVLEPSVFFSELSELPDCP